MAPWQFRTKLVPRKGVLQQHGKIPKHLEVVRVSSDVALETLESQADALPNYWEGQMPLSQVEEKLSHLLLARESWSDSAKMYGESKADSIEIWGKGDRIVDRVAVSFSLSEPNIEFIKAAIAAVRELDCVFLNIQTKEVFEPELDVFIAQAEACSASRFLPHRLSRMIPNPD
jgi:hypothetical protein